MDLKVLLNSTIDKMVESGTLEKAITEAVQKTVTEAVKSSMQTYSDFGKQLEKAIQGALKIHGTIDLPSYNDAILKIVARQVEAATNAVIEKQIAERMKELLQPAPESITLSKLVEEYIDHLKDKRDGGCVCYGEQGRITLIVEKERDWTRVALDDEPDKQKYKCDIQFSVYKDEVISLTFQNQDVQKQLFAGPFYNFERMLFQMKAAKTKVIVDADSSDIETTYELSTHD